MEADSGQGIGLRLALENGLENVGAYVVDLRINEMSGGGGGGGGGGEGKGAVLKEERMCRVCHMGSESSVRSGALTELGCECRNDLGFAHRRCAELWFATKGNRCCEICGVIAQNVSEVRDTSFMMEWSNMPRTSTYMSTDSRYRPACSFLGAIIIAGFVIHLLLEAKPH